MSALRMILGTVSGLAIIAGSVYCWRHYELSGGVAFIAFLFGIGVICCSLCTGDCQCTCCTGEEHDEDNDYFYDEED